MPEMIKRDRLLIACGALAPFRTRTDETDVALECIPKLRQLVEAKFPHPTPDRGNAPIAFASVNVVLSRLICPPAHRSELEKNETSPVAANSFLSEKDWTAVLHPYQQRDKHQQRSAND